MEVSLVDVYKLENTIINEQGMVALVCMQILHLDATEEKDQDVYWRLVCNQLGLSFDIESFVKSHI